MNVWDKVSGIICGDIIDNLIPERITITLVLNDVNSRDSLLSSNIVCSYDSSIVL